MEELRDAAIKYLNEARQELGGFGRWALDSTGFAMPLDLVGFGAKWQLEHMWHTADDIPDDCKDALFETKNGFRGAGMAVCIEDFDYMFSCDEHSFYKSEIKQWAYLDDLIPKEEPKKEEKIIKELTLEERIKNISSDEEHFIHELYFTEFEDGMTNNIIKRAWQKYFRDKVATLTWLKGLFEHLDTRYKDKMLRTVAALSPKDYLEICEPMVDEGMMWYDSSIQEAAIMLAEELRSEACITALSIHPYASDWLKVYGEKVRDEIKKEHSV